MEIDELAVKITGDSTSLQSALNQATESMGKLGINTSALTGLLGGAGLAAAVKLAASAAAECQKAFVGAEVDQLRFNAAVAASSVVTAQGKARLEELASSFAKLAGVDDDAVLGMQAMLAATGRTTEQIEKMLPAALGLANATGVSLDSALEQLNKTFSGSVGRMGMVTPALLELSKEELANGKAVDILADKYGGLSGALADSAQTSMANYETALGNVKEGFGKLVEEGVKPFRDAATQALSAFAENEAAVKATLVGIGLVISSVAAAALVAMAPVIASLATALAAAAPIIAGVAGVAAAVAGLTYLLTKNAEAHKAATMAEIEAQTTQSDALEAARLKAVTTAADRAAANKKAAEESAAAAKKAAEDAAAAQIKGRKTAEESYRAELAATETRVKAGLITEQDAADAKYAANKKLIDDLIALGYTGDAASKSIGDQTLAAAIARNANLYANTKENVENIIAEEAKILAQQKEVADWEKAYLEKKAKIAKDVEAGIVADMISGNQAIVGADAAVTASLVQDAIDYAGYFTAAEEARQAVMKDTAETMTAYNEQVTKDAKKEDKKRKASAELVTADLIQGAVDYAAWFGKAEEARQAAMLDTAETAIAYNNQVVAAEKASAEANKLVMADVAETQVGYSAYLVAEAEKAAEAQKLIAADMAETNVGYVAYVAAEEQKRHDTQIALGEDAALVNNGFVDDAIAAEKKRAKTSALVTADLIQDAADYVQYFEDGERARQAVMADSMATAIAYNGQVVDDAKASADAAALVTADLVQTQTTYNQQIIDAAAKANDTQIALEAAHLHYSVTASGELVGAKMGDLDSYEAYLEEMRAKEKIADAAALAEKEKAFKDAFQNIADAADDAVNNFVKLGTALNSVLESTAKKQQEAVDAALKSQLDAYEAEKQAALEAAGLADKTTLETLQARVDAAYAAGDAEEIAAAEAALKKQQIIEEYDAKAVAATKKAEYEKAVIKYKADIAQYGVNMAMAAAQGALAIIQAFAQLGPIAGAIAAVVIGATTAAQMVVMTNNKPTPPPALALGGVARGSTWVGERGAELVDLPAGSYVHDAQESKRIAAERGNSNSTFNFYSPKALTPAEMKRQFRIAQRQAAFMGGV